MIKLDNLLIQLMLMALFVIVIPALIISTFPDAISPSDLVLKFFVAIHVGVFVGLVVGLIKSEGHKRLRCSLWCGIWGFCIAVGLTVLAAYFGIFGTLIAIAFVTILCRVHGGLKSNQGMVKVN